MPKFVLDKKEIEFTQGETIMQAGVRNGIDIPNFCWHPSLSVSGNCRICLVEIEKMPKLAIACATLAADGMVVHTSSQKALAARNAVMEFLLINHPLDCPICDEAGECKLQDYAYAHSTGESRFTEEMVNPYSLNTTDICPVGALTSKDFRFRARVWDMSSTKSVCNGCARGCNMDIWVRNNEVLRLTPRFNEKVNSYWMCDHGRVNTYKFINAEDRVNGPHLRKDGTLIKVTWNEAIEKTVSELKSYNKSEIAFIGSAYSTVEDNYVFARFAKSVFNSNNIDFIRYEDPSFGDEILRKNDITPNSLGTELVGITPGKNGLNIEGIISGIKDGHIKALYIIEDDIVNAKPGLEDVLAKLDLLIVHATNFNKTASLADIVFPASTYAEKNGTLVNLVACTI